LLLGAFVTNSLAGRTSNIDVAIAEVGEHINDKAQQKERADVSKLQAEVATLRKQRDTLQKHVLAMTFKDQEVAKVLSDIARERAPWCMYSHECESKHPNVPVCCQYRDPGDGPGTGCVGKGECDGDPM